MAFAQPEQWKQATTGALAAAANLPDHRANRKHISWMLETEGMFSSCGARLCCGWSPQMSQTRLLPIAAGRPCQFTNKSKARPEPVHVSCSFMRRASTRSNACSTMMKKSAGSCTSPAIRCTATGWCVEAMQSSLCGCRPCYTVRNKGQAICP